MKKHIFVLCFVFSGIAGYTQLKSQPVYIVGECTAMSSFTSWRKDYQHQGWMLEVQLEKIKDSSIHSTLFRFASSYFKTKDIELSENKFLTMFQTIERLYVSKKTMFKLYCQMGILETFTTDNIEIGALVGGGIHIGKFRQNNLTLEINHVWHTGAYNYFNVQIGFSTDLGNLFKN